jgi:hypothetical protein
MPIDIVIITTLAALFQVAWIMLLLRGVMWLFGPKARNNVVYGIFTVGSMPFIRFARAIMPRAVPDAYIPAIAFLMVFGMWVALAVGQQALCVQRGAQCG